MPSHTPRTVLALALTGLALTACGNQASSAAAGQRLTVDASDTACTLSTTTLPAGPATLAITNSGSRATEVYVYGDGDRVVAEKEDIGPGISYDLTVDLSPGAYTVACKPGMSGDGIRTPITVGASAGAAGATGVT